MNPYIDGLTRRDFAKLLASATASVATPTSSSPEADAFSGLIQSATPADLARVASRGRWRMARHLALLNRYLIAAAARDIKRLVVTMPPRHGKSSLISNFFSAWWLGTFPDQSVAITSYGANLASYWAARSRQVMEEFGRPLFNVAVNDRSVAGRAWTIKNRAGGMLSAGVRGSLTGHGADLLIVDDPVKNNEEAMSPLMRDKTWEWFLSTASTRLEPGGVVVVIMTRWHEDDLVGRIFKDMEDGGERYTVLNLPALAVETEDRFPVSMGRRRGDALWPERYGIDALNAINKRLSAKWWSALYQQMPSPEGGGVFKLVWFPVVRDYPKFVKTVRFWDMASTVQSSQSADPDYTASVKMSLGVDGYYYVTHVTRHRMTPGQNEEFFIQTVREDGPSVAQFMEQEGGSAGKMICHSYFKRLQQERIYCSFSGDPVSASKTFRAEPYAQAAEQGLVRLVDNGSWNIKTYRNELELFPNGTHDDQVDASSGAYSKLFASSRGAPAVGANQREYAHTYSPR